VIDDSYLQRGDGTSQISATINAPINYRIYYYAENAAFALVKGQLHIFGGYSDNVKVLFCLTNQNYEKSLKTQLSNLKIIFKIARLDSCSFIELPARLNEGRTSGHAAVSTENSQKGNLNFDF
jgi:hypothetical protein